MSFQHSAFQPNAFQTGASGGGTPALPFTSNQVASAPSIRQVLLVAVGTSLLCSTLAPSSAQAVPREATLQNAKVTPAVQASQQHNLLTSTLSGAPLPVGEQQTSNLVTTPRVQIYAAGANICLPMALPVGHQQTDSAPPTPRILQWNKDSNVLILPAAIPVGQQHTESSPPTPRIGDISFARGVDPQAPPAEEPIPIGKQETESAPVSVQTYATSSGSNQALLATSSQPLPQGKQRTDNLVQTPSVSVEKTANLLESTLRVIAADLPIGHQQTDSSPPTPRIGDIRFARGVDPQAPAAADPLPIGQQRVESAPISTKSVWAQNSAQLPSSIPASLSDIASSQSEFMFSVRTPAVFNWIPPNTTIRLPVATPDALPIGVQWTDSAPVVANAVWARNSAQLPSLIPGPAAPDALPIGKQRTDSAPPTPRIGGTDQVQNLLTRPFTDMATSQSEFMFVIRTPAVFTWIPPNVTIGLPVIPPDPLPIGRQWTNSAPVVTNAVWAQNSTQDPDSIPPPVYVAPPVTDVPGGWWPMDGRARRVRDNFEAIPEKIDVQQLLEQKQEILSKARAIRRAERKSRIVTEEIRALLDEQEALETKLQISTDRLLANLSDEEAMIVMLLLAS